jgi:predicted transposase YdaD
LTEYSRKYEPLVKSFLPLSQSPAFNAVIRERLATWKKRGREGGREREREREGYPEGTEKERERERERESGGGERGGGRDGKRSLVKVVGG